MILGNESAPKSVPSRQPAPVASSLGALVSREDASEAGASDRRIPETLAVHSGSPVKSVGERGSAGVPRVTQMRSIQPVANVNPTVVVQREQSFRPGVMTAKLIAAVAVLLHRRGSSGGPGTFGKIVEHELARFPARRQTVVEVQRPRVGYGLNRRRTEVGLGRNIRGLASGDVLILGRGMLGRGMGDNAIRSGAAAPGPVLFIPLPVIPLPLPAPPLARTPRPATAS